MTALTILLCSLAATATATASHAEAPSLRQLRPRQAATADDAPSPTTSSAESTATGSPNSFCQSIFETFITEIPPIPTEALEFSEKYYESVTRTASETISDCAWVSAIPESLDEPFVEYFEQLIDFFNDAGTTLDQATLSRCDNLDWSRTDDAVAVCVEFDEYAETLEERHDAANEEDDDSAGRRIPAAVAFAIMMSLVGGAVVW